MTRALQIALWLAVLGFSSSAGAARRWQRLYVFGDSYSDDGAGYRDGNGPTAVHYLAERLNIPFSFEGEKGYRNKGIDFAISGARTDASLGCRITPVDRRLRSDSGLLGRGVKVQVAHFEGLVRTRAIHFQSKHTLFLLAEGINDSTIDPNQSIQNVRSQIRALYAAGARYFLIALLPERLPISQSQAERLNPLFRGLPSQLLLDGAHIAVIPWGMHFDQVYESASEYGFTNVKDPCAGRALFGEETKPCQSPENYYFYHWGHPSTAVHKIVGQMMADDIAKLFSDGEDDPRRHVGQSQSFSSAAGSR